MPKRVNKWTVLAVLAGGGAAGYWAYDHYLRRPSPIERLANQVWVERLMADERDLVHHLVLVEGDRGRVGVTGRASRWRVRADVVRWAASPEGRLQLRFEQERKKVALTARTWECAGEAPRPFELCLSLERNGRRAKFYSRKDWVVRPREAPPAAVDWLAPALDAAERAPKEDPSAPDATAEAEASFFPFE